MLIRFLPIVFVAFLFAGAGCDSSVEPQTFQIPPPSDIADSLYITTPSGLKYYDLEVGEGILAEEGNAIEFHYIMWLNNGTLVNSSYLIGQPQVLILGQDGLIPGWREGFDGMLTGGFRQLLIPPELAYGTTGSQRLGIPPDETIKMELALLRIGNPVTP